MLETIWDVLNGIIRVLWFAFDTVTKITRFWSIRHEAEERADIECGKMIDPTIIEKHAKFKREAK